MSILDELDLSAIQDEQAREGIIGLLNLVEEMSQTIQALQSENQRLKDENNRLKGEQGQPPIKPNHPSAPTNYSSEKERQTKGPRKRRRKRDTIQIDREVTLEVDPTILPPDAVFKGYDKVVVEDVLVRTDNVLFRKEVYYSATESKTYMADMPPGYQGRYGPGIRALSLALYFGDRGAGRKSWTSSPASGLRCHQGTCRTCWSKTKLCSMLRKMQSLKPVCAAVPGNTLMTP
jgi:regulator of replication initiation timing